MEGSERILDVAVVSRRFQVTLTKPVRMKLQVEEGDRIVFLERNGDIIIRKI